MWVRFLLVVYAEMGLWRQEKSLITRMVLDALQAAKLTQDSSVEEQAQYALGKILFVETTSLKLLKPVMMGT